MSVEVLIEYCKRGVLLEVEKYLAATGIDVNKKFRRKTALYVSCEENKPDIVEFLLNLENIELNLECGIGSALVVSSRSGFVEITKQLLSHESIDPNKFSPLSQCCKIGNLEIIKQLLEHPKIDVNRGAKKNCLFIAVENRKLAVVEELLKHPKIRVNVGGSCSPLYCACQHGFQEIVGVLLDNEKIDVNKGFMWGWTPIYIACSNNHIHIVKLMKDRPKLNINMGTDTPLFISCQKGLLEIVKELLDFPNINVNKGIAGGETPLYAACCNGYLEIVKVLLKVKTIDVNKGGKEGTPLYISCCNGHTDIVTELVKFPKLNISKGIEGKQAFYSKPIDIAIEKACFEIVKTLVHHPRSNPKDDNIKSLLRLFLKFVNPKSSNDNEDINKSNGYSKFAAILGSELVARSSTFSKLVFDEKELMDIQRDIVKYVVTKFLGRFDEKKWATEEIKERVEKVIIPTCVSIFFSFGEIDSPYSFPKKSKSKMTEVEEEEEDINIISHKAPNLSSNLNLSNRKIYYFGQISADSKKPNGYGFEFLKLSRSKLIKGKRRYVKLFFGTFANGVKFGEGRIYDTKHGIVSFHGVFQNNIVTGKCREFVIHPNYDPNASLLCQSLLIYEGLYSNGRRNGRGEEYDFDKNSYVSGFWKDGILEKKVDSFSCPIIPFSRIQNLLTHEKIIGRGAWGMIYRVRTKDIPGLSEIKEVGGRKEVAVKIFNKTQNQFEKSVLFASIKRGIKLCGTVASCEYIMPVYAILQGNQMGYCMELCKISVDVIIATSNEELTYLEKFRLLVETAIGMCELHSKNVMHRDLKWGNVMLDFQNRVKITDFETLKEDQTNWKFSMQQLTSTNIGTNIFIGIVIFSLCILIIYFYDLIAPEVSSGIYDLSVDVYSFGLMIYALIFEKNNPYSTLYQCNCGRLLKDIPSSEFPQHVLNCKIRPLIDPVKAEYIPKEYQFLINLMMLAWNTDSSRRPSFKEICKIFDSVKNRNSKNRCYCIVSAKIHDQPEMRPVQLLLMEPTFNGLKKILENYFPPSFKILSVHDYRHNVILYSDDDVSKMISDQEIPTIIITFDRKVEIEDLAVLSINTKLTVVDKLRKKNKDLESELNKQNKNLEEQYLKIMELQKLVDILKLENKELKNIIDKEEDINTLKVK